MEDARSVRGGIIIGIMDFVMLAIVFLWVIFVCGGGTWPGANNPDARLVLFHLAHLALAIPAILLFALSVLFLPIWFAFIGLIVFFVDVFVLVLRFNIIVAGGFSVFCTLFLFLFDIVFLLLAVMYLGFAITAISRFGLFGDSNAVITPYTVPRPNAATATTLKPNDVPSVFIGTGFRKDAEKMAF